MLGESLVVCFVKDEIRVWYLVGFEYWVMWKLLRN